MINLRNVCSKFRVKKLSALIRNHSYKYHVLDEPEIEDSKYDQLFQELLSLEQKFTELLSKTSPTQRIGSKPSAGFKKITHGMPNTKANRSPIITVRISARFNIGSRQWQPV